MCLADLTQGLFFLIGKDMHLVAISLNTWTIARTLRKGSDDAHKHLCVTEHPPRHRLPSYRKQQPCLLQSGCQAACSQHYAKVRLVIDLWHLVGKIMPVTPPGGRFTGFVGHSFGTPHHHLVQAEQLENLTLLRATVRQSDQFASSSMNGTSGT